MNIMENVRLALSSIGANKMRSFLTMLGIIIGIAAVVAISAIGNGGKYQIQKSMEQFGTNRLMIYMNWAKQSEITRRDFLTDRDIEALRKLEGIEAITPILEENSALSVKGNRISVILVGANEDSQIITNVELLKGRFITDDDVARRTNNIVISEREARELFGTIDVIGEQVTMNTFRGQIELVIVGVSKYEDNMFSGAMNNGRAQIYVPISTIMRIYNLTDYYGVNIKVTNKDNMEQISEQAIKLLERLHNNKDKYTAFNMEQMLQTVNKVLGTVTRVLGAIAAIALLVGGIGIMNIMLVAVSERIREIGIKKAIGAKRSTILLQFLTESAIISLLGGIIGIIIGYIIGFIISSFLNLPPLIQLKEVLIASFVAIGIGIIFGVYPANRASKLDPIEALRYE
ncbi:ABC transporter permease [Serpentinicella alkaliphila]|uniref:Putative ABC transport system permease protein n=1 Tax=Serpentinicella alkaliphila TaxID=1734049 RepID=A0A4R2TFH2_9FIRM|nr:ABC transporter permease [Serpentinicella alkaliphila]QUH24885.1 ABC transporter permease [Serpentinicella alkaliphila]TCQ01841.1 putative ABC transport system permease protein [Serpentinicella alkaliphila]